MGKNIDIREYTITNILGQITQNEKTENKVTESTQCNGITKAGQRCKRKTLNASGYCYSHEAQLNGEDSKSKTEENCSKPTYSGSTSTQCTGTTKKGSRCRRMTSSSSGRCYQH